MWTVGEVSALAGVTVRTLHHYDEIGLVSPSERSPAGYRLYSYADLARLQEVLGWRRLGFALEEIRAILDDPAHDRADALARQRELVERDLERLSALRRALDAAIETERNGTRQKESSMFEGFDPSEYEDEARERWGHTEAYRESMRRSASYDETQWAEIRAEGEGIAHEFAALMRAGEPADGAQARAVAERHRRYIGRWFYPCPVEMHRKLGEMYVEDPRFARNYERLAAGLAAYVRDATAANAEAEEAATP